LLVIDSLGEDYVRSRTCLNGACPRLRTIPNTGCEPPAGRADADPEMRARDHTLRRATLP